MKTPNLISENERRIREYQNHQLPKLKPQTKVRQAQLKWLQEQNLMITQEELEALETYTLMIRNKLSILKEVYEV
ncbi:hypothetical protein ACL6C3_02645 [Capilliphycus salinus ALCB114379]|uniref:hypothetical protein n=1 Tax=Capilliphycus salinus TaxID=2768948 RepID=UPI0039A4BF64